MQFSTTAIMTILSAGAALAAPAATAAIPDMTLAGVKRVCNAADTSCTWSFNINTNVQGSKVVPCTFAITGSPASHSGTNAIKTCGTYSVSAGWSGQFGPGFTTLSVFDNASSRIAFPAYTDAELAGGKTVSPDKSWTVTQM